jgi:hypothetical protein
MGFWSMSDQRFAELAYQLAAFVESNHHYAVDFDRIMRYLVQYLVRPGASFSLCLKFAISRCLGS